MIGRTLDKMLDLPQAIGKEIVIRKTKIKRPLVRLTQKMKNLILPIKRKRLYGSELSFEPGNESGNGWSEYDLSDWKLKRKLAKVFENRRKVNVGESFQEQDVFKFWCGHKMEKYEVNRVNKNTVLYRGNVISSDKKELIKYAKEGYIPIHYTLVLF